MPLGPCSNALTMYAHYVAVIGHWLDMVYPPPPRPGGILLTIFFLKPNVLRGFCNMSGSLTMAALSCNSLLYTLSYKLFDN